MVCSNFQKKNLKMWCKFETLPQTSPGQRLSARHFSLKKIRSFPLNNGLWNVNEMRKYEKSTSTQIPEGNNQNLENLLVQMKEVSY